MSKKIKQIYAREILDSRGNPTLEVNVITEGGIIGKAAVPSGASVGVHEALEMRDGDIQRYGGKGVLKAIGNVNTTINEALKGQPVDELALLDQRLIDLDGTPNKARLGANATTGVSLACARAAALVNNLPLYKFINQFYKLGLTNYQLPVPCSNIINGGHHADSNVDIQEFWIIPFGFKEFSERVRAMAEVFHELGKVLLNQSYDSDVGDEGGYAPDLTSNEEALKLISKAVEKSGYHLGQNMAVGLDAGASTFFENNRYKLDLDNLNLTSEEMIDFYRQWLAVYPLMAIEDPLAEDDWAGWQKLTKDFSATNPHLLVVGDDIFTTNLKRLSQGIKEKVANAIIIKSNQIGTLTETIACIKLARENNYQLIISHRSGETEDTFIADLAVGVGAGYIKTGAPSRSDRVAKYNRLLEIEEELRR